MLSHLFEFDLGWQTQTAVGDEIGFLDWYGEQTVYTEPVPTTRNLLEVSRRRSSNKKAEGTVTDVIIFRGTQTQLRKAKINLFLHEGIMKKSDFEKMMATKGTKAAQMLNKMHKEFPVVAACPLNLREASHNVGYRTDIYHAKHVSKQMRFGEVGGRISTVAQPRFRQQLPQQSAEDLDDDMPQLLVKVVKVFNIDPPDQRDQIECGVKVCAWYEGACRETRIKRGNLSPAFNDILRWPVPAMKHKRLTHGCIYIDVMLDDEITQQHCGMVEIAMEDIFFNKAEGQQWPVVLVNDKKHSSSSGSMSLNQYSARVSYFQPKLWSMFGKRELETSIQIEIWTTPAYMAGLLPSPAYYSDLLWNTLEPRRNEFNDVADSLLLGELDENGVYEDMTRWFQERDIIIFVTYFSCLRA